jgi:hypothetical protein
MHPPPFYFLAGVTRGPYFYGLYYFAFLECALPGVNQRPQFGQCGLAYWHSQGAPLNKLLLGTHYSYILHSGGWTSVLALVGCAPKQAAARHLLDLYSLLRRVDWRTGTRRVRP